MGGREGEQGVICAHEEFTRSAPLLYKGFLGDTGKQEQLRVFTYLSIPELFFKLSNCHPSWELCSRTKLILFSLHDMKYWQR